MYASRIFRDRFVEKESGLGTYKLSSTQLGDKNDFWIQQQRTLNSFKEFKTEIKNFQTYIGMDCDRGYQNIFTLLAGIYTYSIKECNFTGS